MLRAILFDVDGTLVDTVDLHARAWQDAFALYGKQVSLEKVRSQIGKGGDQLLPVFLGEQELERWGEALDRARAGLYRERYRPLARPFPGVPGLFRRIRRDGKRVVLASSGKAEETLGNLRLLGVEGLVDAFTTSDEAGGADPREALVVGDSPFDIEAAARLGVPSVGLLCGGFSEADLRSAGAVALFGSPQDLLDSYERSPLARDSVSSGEPASPG